MLPLFSAVVLTSGKCSDGSFEVRGGEGTRHNILSGATIWLRTKCVMVVQPQLAVFIVECLCDTMLVETILTVDCF